MGPVMFPLLVLDAGLKVLAQICPGTSGVVNLLVLVGEAKVVRKARCRKCEDDRFLDVVVCGAVVFDFLFGCCSAQMFLAASSAAVYASWSVEVVAVSGQGRCGRGGTGSMIGLLASSRIGVLVSKSMMENTAAR